MADPPPERRTCCEESSCSSDPRAPLSLSTTGPRPGWALCWGGGCSGLGPAREPTAARWKLSSIRLTQGAAGLAPRSASPVASTALLCGVRRGRTRAAAEVKRASHAWGGATRQFESAHAVFEKARPSVSPGGRPRAGSAYFMKSSTQNAGGWTPRRTRAHETVA